MRIDEWAGKRVNGGGPTSTTTSGGTDTDDSLDLLGTSDVNQFVNIFFTYHFARLNLTNFSHTLRLNVWFWWRMDRNWSLWAKGWKFMTKHREFCGRLMRRLKVLSRNWSCSELLNARKGEFQADYKPMVTEWPEKGMKFPVNQVLWLERLSEFNFEWSAKQIALKTLKCRKENFLGNSSNVC